MSLIKIIYIIVLFSGITFYVLLSDLVKNDYITLYLEKLYHLKEHFVK